MVLTRSTTSSIFTTLSWFKSPQSHSELSSKIQVLIINTKSRIFWYPSKLQSPKIISLPNLMAPISRILPSGSVSNGSPASIQGEFSCRVKSKFSKSTNNGFCSIIPSPLGSHGVQIFPQPGQFSPQGPSPLPHALQ